MESAVYLFVLGLIWALLSLAVVVGLIAVSIAAALDVATANARSIHPRVLLRFNRCHFLRVAGFMLLAIPVAVAVYSLFEWVNSYSLEVASWLTFNTEKPVAQETAESVLGWVEWVLWVAVAGFLGGFLVTLVRNGWRVALRSSPRLLASASWYSTFLTTLISFVIFGGIAQLLVQWNPTVTTWYLDFAQVIARSGFAVVIAVAGWIFWTLALTRFGAPVVPSPPPASST
jgi:hypothetical protein